MTNLISTWASERVGGEYRSRVPDYLEKTYWWAYVRPAAVAFWDRKWLVNLILFGNFVRLRDAALNELGASIPGRTLQIACVYSDFSVKLAERVAQGGSLDIVDVLPVQLNNVRRKLPELAPVRTLQRDSTKLMLADASYDQVLLFFLLHEQPDALKEKTLSEALRVLKPGGKLVIVDYDRPALWHPLRPLLYLVLKFLEPFALVLWHREIESWLPAGKVKSYARETLFGGMYQKIVIHANRLATDETAVE